MQGLRKSSQPVIAFLLLALFCVGLGACAGPRLEPGAPVNEPEYRIAPPDTLQITVRPEPVITRDVQVRPDGKISFDLIGEIDVYGKTVAEIRDDITQRIREFIVAPDVTVTLMASNSRRYYVFGEVGRPGVYPLEGEVRVIEAIAQAGGLEDLGNGDDVAALVLADGDIDLEISRGPVAQSVLAGAEIGEARDDLALPCLTHAVRQSEVASRQVRAPRKGHGAVGRPDIEMRKALADASLGENVFQPPRFLGGQRVAIGQRLRDGGDDAVEEERGRPPRQRFRAGARRHLRSCRTSGTHGVS